MTVLEYSFRMLQYDTHRQSLVLCFQQIREAAQALLLAELQRIGPEGRKQVVDSWAPYLPTYVDPAVSLIGDNQPAKLATTTTLPPELYDDAKDEDEDVMLGGSE